MNPADTFRTCFAEAHQRIERRHCGPPGAHVHPGGGRLHGLSGCVVCGADDGEVYGIRQAAARGKRDFFSSQKIKERARFIIKSPASLTHFCTDVQHNHFNELIYVDNLN